MTSKYFIPQTFSFCSPITHVGGIYPFHNTLYVSSKNFFRNIAMWPVSRRYKVNVWRISLRKILFLKEHWSNKMNSILCRNQACRARELALFTRKGIFQFTKSAQNRAKLYNKDGRFSSAIVFGFHKPKLYYNIHCNVFVIYKDKNWFRCNLFWSSSLLKDNEMFLFDLCVPKSI